MIRTRSQIEVEMAMTSRWIRFALVPILFVVAHVPWAQADEIPPHRSGVDSSGLDPAVRPQDDFFRHINGAWIARTAIPADRSAYGSFFVLRDTSESNLRTILENAAATDLSANSDARKIGDLYQSFMDEARVDELGKKPIEADLARVDAVTTKTALVSTIASLEREGVRGLFGAMVSNDAKRSDRYILYLEQGGISLPDESYYREAKFKPIRDAFVAHVARLFEIAGVPDPKAAATRVMTVETELARHHWDRVKSRDRTRTYNKLDRKQLDQLTPGFGWDDWLKEYGCKPMSELIVRQPDYFTAMASQLDVIPLDDWKAWLKWQVLHQAAPLLSKPFVDEDFVFFSKMLTGTPELRPRWKRGVEVVERAMGEAAGKIYVAKHFPPQAKARMQELVANLIAAYRANIAALEWMSPETRKKALDKLDKFNPKIGYPDKWRDFAGLEIRRDDLVGNAKRATAFDVAYHLARLDKPVDRDEWHMTPQTVNAYYNPNMNEIVFPAAILQPPFFDMQADDAVNYGAIGAVIGHEIGHGFDDQGSKFDGAGNMVNWWTEPDRKEFEARAKMLIDQYNHFEPVQLPGQKVNGAMTIGENIGDLGGLSIAYKAYKRSLQGQVAPVLAGLTGDQRFFVGWAQAWRSKYRDAELARRLATDPHSPPEFRCNGVLRNLPEFYAAFGVKEGDKLWLVPDQRVRIW
jgi:putative endopeptidase